MANENEPAEPEKKICGAKTRKGTPCQKAPIKGRNRCRKHGGATPRGFKLPQTKHGRYSLDLPEKLRTKYEQAEADPELLSSRAEVALLDARAKDLARRLHTGESGSLWLKLGKVWNDLQAASVAKDAGKFQAKLTELGRVIRDGNKDEATWNELVKAIDDRDRLARSERARLRELHQMLTAEQAMLLVTAVISAVRDALHDQAELNQLLSMPPGPERDKAAELFGRKKQKQIGLKISKLLHVNHEQPAAAQGPFDEANIIDL